MRNARARRRRRLQIAVTAFTISVASTVLSCGGIVRYQVTKTPSDDCIIRSNGEFCDEEDQLSAPTVQSWGVEVIDEEESILYIGEEVWIVPSIEGEQTVVKTDRSTSGVCTTTRTQTLTFLFSSDDEIGNRVDGTFEEKIRTEGPDACGDTPFGSRLSYVLFGTPGGVL